MVKGVISVLVATAAVVLGLAKAEVCTNKDYQVVVYRYTDDLCSSSDETIALYQSGQQIIESHTVSKTFTCCDDLKTVTVLDSTASGNTTVNVVDAECLKGGSASTGQSFTTEVRLLAAVN